MILKKNWPHGKGKTTYKDGSYTEGDYFEGFFEKGVYWSDGNKYSGTFWHNLKLIDHGEIHFKSGEIYTGDTVDNLPNGRGKLVNVDSSKLYDGEWIEGKKTGKFRVSDREKNLMLMGKYENDKKVGYWVTMNPYDYAADTGKVIINKYDHLNGKVNSLEINSDKEKVTFCKGFYSSKLHCRSNSILEWEYIGKRADTMTGLSFRKYIFEDDYLAPNLRLAFNALNREQKQQIIDEVQTEEFKVNSQTWSIKLFTFLAIQAATEHSTLSLNNKEVVKKVISTVIGQN